ncbi:MAG: hypothetical protein QM723_22550 [Myxococcaceae bacterium]
MNDALLNAPKLVIESGANSFEWLAFARPFANATSDWDRDAIDCQLKFTSNNGTQYAYDTLFSHEIWNLANQLRLISETREYPMRARYRTRSYVFALQVEVQSAEDVRIELTLRPNPEESGQFSFAGRFSQRDTERWLGEARGILERFPIQLPAPEPREPLDIW